MLFARRSSESASTESRYQNIIQKNYMPNADLYQQGSDIEELRAYLAENAINSLDNIVKQSVLTNETAILTANMLVRLKETSEQAQRLASAVEELEASTGELNNFSGIVTESTEEATQKSDSSIQASLSAIDKMNAIQESVQHAVSKTEELSSVSENIIKITDTINNIAFQTKLLALNASVEAARAGEAGKGFAVVASEIQRLSSSTTDASMEINQIIANLHSEMSDMREIMDKNLSIVNEGREIILKTNDEISEVQTLMKGVNQNAYDMKHTVFQQTEATKEISSGILNIADRSACNETDLGQISEGMDEMVTNLNEQIVELSGIEVPGKVVKLAKSDHVLWKKRLANMVAGREGLKADELADHHTCRLGKWYDSVTDERITSSAYFIELQEPHASVHAHGIRAVELYNMGKYQQAMQEIVEVEKASAEVLRLLDLLDEELDS